jgi:hypothetical protein
MAIEKAPESNAPADNLITSLLYNSVSEDELEFCMWALGIIYGWKVEKIKKFKVSTLAYWISKARKRITVGDLMGIHFFIRSKQRKQNIWQRVLTKN